MENGNDRAGFMLAGVYANGLFGETQDIRKANELYLIAGELGCAEAYHNLGNAYSNGRTVEVDEEKAKHYWELAAMGGDVMARCNLGFNEVKSGNLQRAKKHFLISARAGTRTPWTGFRLDLEMVLLQNMNMRKRYAPIIIVNLR